MNKRTLAALKGSIKKWEKIVDGTGVDSAALNCPLCELFIIKGCAGCPVAEYTHLVQCMDTPWGEWSMEHDEPLPWRAQTAKQKKYARLELKFLRSLLPEQ